MCLNKFPVKIGTRLSPGGQEYPVYEYVSCRKCEECIKTRRSQWCFRILTETEHCYNSSFLTLTYNDDHLPVQGVQVRDCQLFFKRLRKNISLWYPDFDTKQFPIRYFLVSEYGSKFKRPHYHMILWNCPLTDEEIEKTWKNGFIKNGNCEEASVQYCLKYFAIKQKAPENRTTNFCLMSKNIGSQWLADNLFYVKSYVRMPGSGYKVPLPSSWRKKLGFPKREYFWNSEPDIYERFSPKYLRSRGLCSRRALYAFIDRGHDKLNVLAEDAENYYLYRDDVFRKKYDKCNNKDNQ